MTALRSFFYYLVNIPYAAICGCLGVILLVSPYRFRYWVVTSWNRVSVSWMRFICGVDYKILGADNVPEGPYVVLAKHQSDWETLFLQYYFAPLSTILKKELLHIPFFGWGLACLKPIAIDRSNPREAIKQLKRLGLQRIQEGNNVLVFPEGTRVAVGEAGNYARGGADIAVSAGVPIIPVAHNAGECCPRRSYMKHAGLITVSIGKPIETEGKTSRELTQEVKDWIENEIANMPTARQETR